MLKKMSFSLKKKCQKHVKRKKKIDIKSLVIVAVTVVVDDVVAVVALLWISYYSAAYIFKHD